ncbi:hypothetical protein ESZ50_05650 [Weissella muntiaci]|uniref:Uncharacterized protein n=2 Tax=Weissella muntiaci TaxID=2508881 RepID=A0A6C2C6V5_9LACO|nr:hypothetical protein ESZ50_05650 [Weissella muntiaci]
MEIKSGKFLVSHFGDGLDPDLEFLPKDFFKEDRLHKAKETIDRLNENFWEMGKVFRVVELVPIGVEDDHD